MVACVDADASSAVTKGREPEEDDPRPSGDAAKQKNTFRHR